MADHTKVSSPSRTYIAICPKMNFNGYYFRKFTLPERMPRAWFQGKNEQGIPLENNAETAGWFFLNELDFESMLDFCVPAEEFHFKVISQNNEGVKIKTPM